MGIVDTFGALRRDRVRVHRHGADKTERLRMRFPRFIGFLLLASVFIPVSAAGPAAPVRDVAESHFGVTVHDPYRYFEDLEIRKSPRG